MKVFGLGGIQGADAKCNEAAARSGIAEIRKREFVAWISINANTADDRLAHGTMAYKRVDSTVVASNWGQFASVIHLAAINLDENGVSLSQSFAWTGTAPAGGASASFCSDWTKGDAGDGMSGDISVSASPSWTQNGNVFCLIAHRLYCIER